MVWRAGRSVRRKVPTAGCPASSCIAQLYRPNRAVLLPSRALAGANRIHQVENPAALFAIERCGMEIANELRAGAFDVEEFICKELEDV